MESLAPDLPALLRSRGLRVTPQRLVIHRVLAREGGHVSADRVRELVAEDLPGTSTPTIYATLDLLADLGLVRRVNAGTGATLYDARTTPHHHAACTECGRVVDLDADVPSTALHAAARDAGFDVAETGVVVYGRCARC